MTHYKFLKLQHIERARRVKLSLIVTRASFDILFYLVSPTVSGRFSISSISCAECISHHKRLRFSPQTKLHLGPSRELEKEGIAFSAR